jgi:hypothetical protein
LPASKSDARKELSSLRFERLVAAIAFLGVAAMAARVSADSDTFWHLRAGAWILEHREVLRADPFSLTRNGEPWEYPGWLAEIALYGAFRAFGYAGLNLLTAASVVAAFALLWPTLEGPALLKAFVLCLAAVTSAVYWSARPQILSFALAAAFLFVLEKWRDAGIRRLWVLPVLIALWANLHGGFVIGFLLLFIYLAGALVEIGREVFFSGVALPNAWRARKVEVIGLVGAVLLSVAAVGVNPDGPSMLLYPFKTVSIGVLQDYIQEWQSPNFHRLEVQPFLWMLLLGSLAFALSTRTKRASELIGFLGFAAMGLLAGRNIALFALVAAPPLSRHAGSAIEPLVRRIRRGPDVPPGTARLLNTALFVLALIAAAIKIAIPLGGEVNRQAIRERLPVAAADWIREHRPVGPLFNSYNWGGYILWALYPEYPSFVDGRTDLFDDEILSDYLLTWRAEPGWEEVFARWGIRLALLEPGAPLVLALEMSGWERLYEDDQAIVMGRPGPP